MATPTLWRFVLLFSSFASIVQLCLSQFIVETPVYLTQLGRADDTRDAKRYLFQQPGHIRFVHQSCQPVIHRRLSASVEDPLLDDTGDASQDESDDHWGTPRSKSISITELLKSRELRRPLVVGSFAMISQQLSGMNVFLFLFSLILTLNTGINASTGSGMLYHVDRAYITSSLL
jgi:SP family facilitated glucose transporter-like MFS transporter 3